MDIVVFLLLLFTWWMRRSEKRAIESISKHDQEQLLKEIRRL